MTKWVDLTAVPSSSQESGEVWLVRWHRELHIRPRFVDEVMENRARDDVGGCESAVADGGSDDGHTPVLL